MMSRLPCLVSAAICTALLASTAHSAEVVRHSLLGGSKFPIARAVEVPAGTTILFHSGTTPAPADPKAPAGTAAYWGDTKTQALSTFAKIKESLDQLGLGFGDVVAMTVYLVGDPAKDGRMDFDGFWPRTRSSSAPPLSRTCRHAQPCRSRAWFSRACWWRSKFSWSDGQMAGPAHPALPPFGHPAHQLPLLITRTIKCRSER